MFRKTLAGEHPTAQILEPFTKEETTMRIALSLLLACTYWGLLAGGNKVTFTVTDQAGNPIANASAVVIWKVSKDHRTYKSCTTDNEGTCTVTGIPNQREVVISAEAEGFVKRDGTIDVNGDTTKTLKLTRSGR